jgi:hypothetical protein
VPETTPVPATTLTPDDVVDQVPPAVASLNVVVIVVDNVVLPVIAETTGTGLTVTFITVVAVLEPLLTCMVNASVPL